MKKLDWYIFLDFLKTFFFAIFLLSVISIVIDITQKMDDFVRSGQSATYIFLQYYTAFVPYIIGLLFPLFSFIAVIFFTSKLAGRSEFIAILASGVSFKRILRPYLVAGISLAVVLWFGSWFLIPQSEVRRANFEARYVDDPYANINVRGNNYYFRIDSFTYAGVRYFDISTKSGGPFFMHRTKGGKVVYNLRSETMEWDSTKQIWRLHNVYERSINGLHEKVSDTLVKEMKFNFTPSDLSKDDYTKNKMTTPALKRRIDKERLRGTEGLSTLEMELHRRSATPVSVIILALMGAIIAIRKVRGGSGLHLAFGFIIAASYVLTDRFSTVFCIKGNLPAYIAAWIPNVLFCFVTYWLYKKAPK